MNKSSHLILISENLKVLSESDVKSMGWYLLDEHKIWIRDKLAVITQVPTDSCYQWEYNPPLTASHPSVVSIIKDFNAGYRLPLIEVRKDGSRYKISDGQHRWLAWKSLGHKYIPVMLSN